MQIWATYYDNLKKETKLCGEKIANEFMPLTFVHSFRETCQIIIKIKNLTDAYKEAKAKNCKSGNGRETSPFYELIDEVMGCKDSTYPTYLMESTGSELTSSPESSETSGILDYGDIQVGAGSINTIYDDDGTSSLADQETNESKNECSEGHYLEDSLRLLINPKKRKTVAQTSAQENKQKQV